MKLQDMLNAVCDLEAAGRTLLQQQLYAINARERALEEEENNRKLTAFVKAVRKAGFLKSLKTTKATKSVRLPVEVLWDYEAPVEHLERADSIQIHIRIVGEKDEVLAKLFSKEVRSRQQEVFNILKEVEKLAKEYGVLELQWEDAVGFLWSEC